MCLFTLVNTSICTAVYWLAVLRVKDGKDGSSTAISPNLLANSSCNLSGDLWIKEDYPAPGPPVIGPFWIVKSSVSSGIYLHVLPSWGTLAPKERQRSGCNHWDDLGNSDGLTSLLLLLIFTSFSCILSFSHHIIYKVKW